ncbi:MAG: sel1 repeat family protein [Lachnospiraceae bacterium]|nr:sel1 repeat family protein [Lachnospiraceae bacterium]
MALFDRLIGGKKEETTDVLLGKAEQLLNRGQFERAFQMYREIAMNASDTTAQYNLGSLYAQGRGTPQDFLEGAYWFRQAEKQGDEQAGKLVKKCELDYMRQNLNAYMPKEIFERMQKFVVRVYPEESEETLVKRELTVLGMHHFNQKDYSSAAKLFRASAEFCDDGQAQNFLGVLYNAGAGVEKNDLVAIYWFDRADDNKYKEARKDLNGILEGYRSSLTPEEFQQYFELLANWCENGTTDVAAFPKKAAYWRRIAMSEREKLQRAFYIDQKRHVLEFEKKTVVARALDGITPENYVYTVGKKQFTGEEPVIGDALEEFETKKGSYVAIKQDRYGDKVLYEYDPIPTFDSSDREWDSYGRMLLLYSGCDICLIAIRGGYKIARIELYEKLKLANDSFQPYLQKLDYPAYVTEQIRWLKEE